MLVPTQEFLNDLPRIAKAYWAHRLERITNERRRLSTVLQDVKTLNQKILLQKVNGELLPEDFALLKETVTQQTTEAETQMTSLDTETATMGRLMEDKQREIVDVVEMWRNSYSSVKNWL